MGWSIGLHQEFPAIRFVFIVGMSEQGKEYV